MALETAALAEPPPSLDLRGFEAPTHPEGLTRLEPTAAPERGEWNVGSFLSYAYRPVVVPARDPIPRFVAVRNQLALDLVGSLGVAPRLAVGVVLPAVLFQNGERPPAASGYAEPPVGGLGDVALDARATLVKQGALAGLGLAAVARVSFPSGQRHAYFAENDVRTELRLLAELGVLGSSLRASAGARVRGGDESFAGHRFGDDLPWGLGLVLKPQAFGLDREGAYLFEIEGHGAVALSPRFGEKDQTPAALGIAGRRAFGDAHAMAGVELPLDGAPGVPSVRVVVGVGFAPRVHDADGDGIPDDRDQCAELAEDRDGFEDSDGCPDFDNDGDGVPDADDRCPHALEDLDDFQDDDGCPDPDNDGDGIPDTKDACPLEAGIADADPKLNGCPFRDADHDGIADARDRCPRRAEDRDGFEDDDGCPEWDNDRDGVHDREDACPLVPGPRRSDPTLNGCPSPDHDGDTFDDAVDRCPNEPETFDGVDDDDGCPEVPVPGHPRRPLAALEPATGRGRPRFVLKLGAPLGFGPAGELLPSSEPVLRAIAELLNAAPETVLMVAVRPAHPRPDAEQAALTRAFTLVEALRALTHRDEAAEVIGWQALARVPGAALPSGLGFLVLAPAPREAPAAHGKAPGRERVKEPR